MRAFSDCVCNVVDSKGCNMHEVDALNISTIFRHLDYRDFAMIPNIVHFVFINDGSHDFKLVNYLAVVSAIIVNQPEHVWIWYDNAPVDRQYWDLLRTLTAKVGFKRLRSVPHQWRDKPILQAAHRADKVRMMVLNKYGGVYLDLDTICVTPWQHLLRHSFVMGMEFAKGRIRGLCNAVMFSEPRAPFLRLWAKRYYDAFVPEGWNEASVQLPLQLSKEHPDMVKVLPKEAFFYPAWDAVHLIFKVPQRVPRDLITLHWWNTKSKKYVMHINGPDWFVRNADTMYGRIMLGLLRDRGLADHLPPEWRALAQ